MDVIEVLVDNQNDLSVYTVKGKVNAQDILMEIEAYIKGAHSTRVLWDFTSARLERISNEDSHTILQAAKKFGKNVKEGKVAMVFSHDLGFGMGRMFETLSEIEHYTFEFNTFRTIEDARTWLGISE